jgi:hypothetical protein
MSSMSREVVLVNRLVDQLLQMDDNPGELHPCPLCGGKLHVSFELYSRGSRDMLGISVWCEGCDLAVATDGDGSCAPQWLRGMARE